MALIELETRINAPIELCFDLSRSMDLHMKSMEHTNEKAVAGVVSGLINLHETVTWRAKHLGWYHQMTNQISEMNAPYYFEDIMVAGPFKYLRHKHFFIEKEGDTLMKDVFEFSSPFGWLGQLVDMLFLKRYMTKLLVKRNNVIQQSAEKK